MKKKLTEAQVNLSIQDLSSSDLQTLSQILSLAGQAEQAAGLMGGMGGMASTDPMGGMMDAGAPQGLSSVGEDAPLAMAGPDENYGMDAGMGDDLGLGGDDLGMDDPMGGEADMDMDLGGLDTGAEDIGMEGGDDMIGSDEFDLSADDLGMPAEDDMMESFERMFALAGLMESEEEEIDEAAHDEEKEEEIVEEGEGDEFNDEEDIVEENYWRHPDYDYDDADEYGRGATRKRQRDPDDYELDEDGSIIALDLNDPKVKSLVGDIDMPDAAQHTGMGEVPAAGMDAAPEISHAVPSAQTIHPGMGAEPDEGDSMEWLNKASAGTQHPGTQPTPAAGTEHPGMGDVPAAGTQHHGMAPQMGKAAKPSWMEEMREDMDVFEEDEPEEDEGEELNEEAMYDLSLDEDAVEEMRSPGIGDNRVFGPYSNEREAVNDARTECPAGVVGRDFDVIHRPNGYFWKKKGVAEDAANSRPKLQDYCTKGIENGRHDMAKAPGKQGDNTLVNFMESADVNTIHASLNEQFARFMKGGE